MDEHLVLFVEKAYRLKSSKFWSWATSQRGQPDWERLFAGEWMVEDKLEEDWLEAFSLNLRVLIQDRDGISLRCIKRISTTWPIEYQTYSQGIEKAIFQLNECLSKNSLVNLRGNGKTTNGELFEIIFYGGIVHLNPEKRAQFKQATEAGLFSFFVFQAFMSAVFHYHNCIQTVAYNIVQYSNSLQSK